MPCDPGKNELLNDSEEKMMRFFKNFTGRTSTLGRLSLVFSLLAVVSLSSVANATPLSGAILTTPGMTNFLGPVCYGGGACMPAGPTIGMQLAYMSAAYSFTTAAGTTSGVLLSAVWKNSSGTLDFYYQVKADPTSATAIARETNDSFAGFMTSLGFLLDGTVLNAGNMDAFVTGDKSPFTGDSNGTPNPGAVIGFTFSPPVDSNKIGPGQSSSVLVISTNAVNFTKGNSSVIDGGTKDVISFEPTSATPEPASFALLGLGLLAIGGIGRKIKARS